MRGRGPRLFQVRVIHEHVCRADETQLRILLVWGMRPKITVKAEEGQSNKEAMDAEDLRSYRAAMVRGPLRALLGRDKHLARAQQ